MLPKSDHKHLSIHAAAVEAGITKKTLTVPDDLDAAASALVKHYGTTRVLDLVDAIHTKIGTGPDR